MQRFLKAIQQFFSQTIWVLSLISLLSLSGLFIFTSQPTLAAPDNPLTTPPQGNKTELGLSEQGQQEAYKEATETLNKDPLKGTEKLYEEEYKEYKESQPKQGLVEKTKELVEDITSK
ncbi:MULTISPECIES: hypothetical protein [unclassified Coleofasciculus]|uniref:hypothetical protein n=1 Tax=unclassified Coleofasciculus TaxID=2692782 RepID=UPI00187DDD3B|nr:MULTISPECIES: hypothetical protein [unclassified Coleofasciculus]MBE9126469.1 hypothetical protein [Coleofasciculus sp. LEGE 07081]MBE9148907.1 hypothetical protein [Coleofasciculus sp. LEGE 07092]